MTYEGYRWLYVTAANRDKPQQLTETKGDMTPKQAMWKVAKLNIDKTQVLHVYTDKCKAARSIGAKKGMSLTVLLRMT